MANRFTGMMQGLDPQTARLVAAISGAPQNRSVSVQRNDPRLSQTVEADKLARAQAQADKAQQTLSNVPKGLRQAAPLVGVINSIAAQMQRKNDNRTLEELYGNVQAQEAEAYQRSQQEKQEAKDAAQQQAQLARQQAVDDAAIEHQRKVEAESAKQGDISNAQMALERYKTSNRAAPKPSALEEKMAAVARVRSEVESGAITPEEGQRQMLIVSPEIEEDRRGQLADAKVKENDAAELQLIIDEIDEAMNIQNEMGAHQTGKLAGRLGNWSDDAMRLNQIYTGLGLDRLGKLKGGSSDKEMDVVFSAGPTMKQDKLPNIHALASMRKAATQRRNALLPSEPQGGAVDFNDL